MHKEISVKKVILAILIFVLLPFVSGCAVIDFLDGKHLDHSSGYDRPQYNGGYDSGSHGGGHSH